MKIPAWKTRIHIGTSGWNYADWKGTFYPGGLPQKSWLAHYARTFQTVEINATFYRIPSKNVIRSWKQAVPEQFIFSCKAHRMTTHVKKLRSPKETIKPYLSVIRGLRPKLGPILIQLPPSLKHNQQRLDQCLRALPKNHRFAFEFRNPSWFNNEVRASLQKHHCAFVIYHMAGQKTPHWVTTDFVYIRMHGASGKYQGKYQKRDLGKWAERIQQWAKTKKDVYCYFNNDPHAHAPINAQELKQLLGIA